MSQTRIHRDNISDTQALMSFLRDNAGQAFPAAVLTERTGVAKQRVRALLRSETDVQTLQIGGKTHYQFKAPQLAAVPSSP